MQLPPNSIIASGPVIIENNKVLLNKHGNDEFWKFPGGTVEDFDIPFEETAVRETKEELGIDIEIIKPLNTLMAKKDDKGVVVLVHFLAKRIGEIKPAKDIQEWKWIDINNMPNDLAPNIKPILDSLE